MTDKNEKKPRCHCGGFLHTYNTRTHADGKIHRNIQCQSCKEKTHSVEISLEEYRTFAKTTPETFRQMQRAHEIIRTLQSFVQEER